MATAYTSLLGLALPVQGELQGTWGDTVNNSITSLLDTAVAGTTTLSSDADVTLTTTTGASNQARQAIILWTASGTVTRNITAPAQSKIYTVINKTGSTQSIVLRGVGPTTGVTIPAGAAGTFAWNGTDFVDISNYVSGNKIINGNLTVNGNTTLGDAAGDTITVNGATTFANVNPTLSAGTANGVGYLNGSKVLTTGSALTFDGTTFAASNVSTGGSVTLSGGTANGVGYLNGSKVLTTGSALTFDGTTFAASNVSTGGSVTLSGGTANGVLYLNGSKVATSGAALTFDGTTLGTNKFSATGDALASGGLRVQGSYSVNAANQLALQNSAGLGGIYINGTTTGSGNRGSLAIWLQDSAGANYINPYNIDSSGNSIWSPGGTEQMRLTSTGLGIGTSSPAYKLDVNGTLGVSGNTTLSGAANVIGGANASTTLVIKGTTKGIRFGNQPTYSLIEGVDNTGGGSFQPLTVGGSTVTISCSGTDRALIDASGNLGLGVTPSAWSDFKVFQISQAAILGFPGQTHYTQNVFWDGSNWKYITSAEASRYFQANGAHAWFSAGSGTAGNTATFTQAMTLDANGNLGIGTTTLFTRASIAAANSATSIGSQYNPGILNIQNTNTTNGNLSLIGFQDASASINLAAIGAVNTAHSASPNSVTGELAFYTKAAGGGYITERMRLDASGNLGLGVTPSAWRSTEKAVQFGTVGSVSSYNGITANLRLNSYTDSGGTDRYMTNGPAQSFGLYNNAYTWNIAASGTAGGAISYTNAMTLDGYGNLGLGVTPSAWSGINGAIELQNGAAVAAAGTYFYNSTNAYYQAAWKYKTGTGGAALYTQSNGTHSWSYAASGTAGNAISFTQAMTLDASGNLGIGLTSLTQRFQVERTWDGSTWTKISNGYNTSGAAVGVLLSTDQGDAGALSQNSSNAGYGSAANAVRLRNLLNAPVTFETNNTERARITSGGDLLVGTTDANPNSGVGVKAISTGAVYVVNASGDGFDYYNSTAAAYRFYVTSAGTIYATNTTISAISDQRFKENIQDLDAGLEKIMALKPRRFDWKTGKGKGIKGDRGFIAQEFEQVFPDLIDEWKDPAPEGEEPYKSVRQDLIPVLVKAIQELKAEIDNLKTQLKGK